MNKKFVSFEKIVTGFVIAFLVFSLLAAFADRKEIIRVLTEASWEWMIGAVLATIFSYTFLSLGFSVAARIFGIKAPTSTLLKIGFITNVLNNFGTIGGAASYSLRLTYFRKRGESTLSIFSASILHSYFNTLALLTLLPIGFLFLLLLHPLSSNQKVLVIILTFISLLVVLFTLSILISAKLRNLIKGFLKKIIKSKKLNIFESREIFSIKKDPLDLVKLSIFVFCDWTISIVVLWFCFLAFNVAISVPILISGLAIGAFIGIISFIPGGLGIQDAGMAGVFTFFGLPLEEVILATVLFRIVYYIIPLGISTIYYFYITSKD